MNNPYMFTPQSRFKPFNPLQPTSAIGQVFETTPEEAAAAHARVVRVATSLEDQRRLLEMLGLS